MSVLYCIYQIKVSGTWNLKRCYDLFQTRLANIYNLNNQPISMSYAFLNISHMLLSYIDKSQDKMKVSELHGVKQTSEINTFVSI